MLVQRRAAAVPDALPREEVALERVFVEQADINDR